MKVKEPLGYCTVEYAALFSSSTPPDISVRILERVCYTIGGRPSLGIGALRTAYEELYCRLQSRMPRVSVVSCGVMVGMLPVRALLIAWLCLCRVGVPVCDARVLLYCRCTAISRSDSGTQPAGSHGCDRTGIFLRVLASLTPTLWDCVCSCGCSGSLLSASRHQ